MFKLALKYFCLLSLLLITSNLWATEPEIEDEFLFNDERVSKAVEVPSWFKPSFLDLKEELVEARQAGKKGLVIYFGQKHCAYCKALMEVNFTKPDIVTYTRKYFEVIAIDIWGDREVTDFQGKVLSEKNFAIQEKTNYTPSLLFYDLEGREALYLPSYYPPYKFRAALKYVVNEDYLTETFRQYLAKGEPGFVDESGLNQQDFFSPPPYMLDRSKFHAKRPLAVFFEYGHCHACNILHTITLKDDKIRKALKEFEVVQVNMWSDVPVITPDGQKITAKQWADELKLFYAPSIIFFDEQGKELMRLDSVTHVQRFSLVLRYILTKGYQKERYFLRWRERYTSSFNRNGRVTY